MESFGLGYEDLRGRFPRLVYASAKGYASDGPWARLGAMDSTVQASSGFMSVTGYPDRSGVKTPATFIDMGTGSHLVSGILAALLQRERSGRGQKVEVAMLDVCVPALTGAHRRSTAGAKLERLGNRHRNACPSDVYPDRRRRNSDLLPHRAALAHAGEADGARGVDRRSAFQESRDASCQRR